MERGQSTIVLCSPKPLPRLVPASVVSFFHDHLPYFFLIEVEKFVDELEIIGRAFGGEPVKEEDFSFGDHLVETGSRGIAVCVTFPGKSFCKAATKLFWRMVSR